MQKKEEKYIVREVNVCTFNLADNGYVRVNIQDFPDLRLCVIDTENNIAIDVNHELKYDFLGTQSTLAFYNFSIDKIKGNKRAALLPINVSDLEDEQEKRVNAIIKKLKKGFEFEDGNEVLTNEQYLELVEQETEQKYEKTKQKKIFKGKN